MADLAGAPTGEDAVLVAVQSALADKPGVLPAARAMSFFGEHSLGWMVVAGLGAWLVPRRRRQWIAAGAGGAFPEASSRPDSFLASSVVAERGWLSLHPSR